jgi:glycosyltransferase involved in cell wall biosynthesis
LADYEWGVRAYRSLMFCCDLTTASTLYLVERMQDLGRTAFVVPNSVNASQQALAERLIALPEAAGGPLRICYFSGSRTHARDFAECESAVIEILKQYSNVRFMLAGYLDLGSNWDAVSGQVERLPFISPLEMLEQLQACDINLAPLEEANTFCEGKSELKIFEAGLVQTVTVASRTATYARCIDDGRDGMLASSEAEWLKKLEALVRDADLRKTLGRAARTTALSAFTAQKAAAAAATAYGLKRPYERPAIVRPDALKIGWIIPGIIIGGGGHRNILRAAHHLETFGHDVRLYFTEMDMSDDELKRVLNQHFYPFGGPATTFKGSVDGEDVLMATHWSTVEPARAAAGPKCEVMYFVQDFEPAFYAMGSEYIMAENTYRRGLYAITSGPWCEHLLKRDYGMDADHFRFPIDRDIYWNDSSSHRANRLLFFAKPDMPRRCFGLGVAALAEVHRLRPDLEIMFFGSESARQHPVDFPVRYSGVLPGIDDLAELYRGATIGMVFSTTNPSLVPYEMMACGLPVIDLDRPGNEVNYDGRRDLALLADPDPVRMAENICNLLERPLELEARRTDSLNFTNGFPTETEMARRIEMLIQARLASIQLDNPMLPDPSFAMAE